MAKILVIDDDDQVLGLITIYMLRDGHAVVTARNGKEGIKELSAKQFDLVITDIIMPEQDGIGVLRWLKGQKYKPKVLAITGGSASLDSDYILELSSIMKADMVLPKPVAYNTLKEAVNELLA